MIDRIANTMATNITTMCRVYVRYFSVCIVYLCCYRVVVSLNTTILLPLKEANHLVNRLYYRTTFVIPVFIFISPQASGEYIAGWAVEKALSLDTFCDRINFVNFKIPPSLERHVELWVSFGAIVLG